MMTTRIAPSEQLDDATVAAANERLAKAGITSHAPVTAVTEQTAQQVLAQTPTPTAVDRGPGADTAKQRTTVGKLLKRYQDRLKAIADSIIEAQTIIDIQREHIDECERQQAFWREAIAEIERD